MNNVLIFLVFFTLVFPSYFATTMPLGSEVTTLVKGIRYVDIVYMVMIVKILRKLLEHKLPDKKVINPLLLLFAYMLFEVVRTVCTYSLFSAVSELKYNYGVLILPLFIATVYDTEPERRKLFKLLLVISFFPTFMFPVLGVMKGWAFGNTNRYYTASISLGLLYGIIGAWMGVANRQLRIKPLTLSLFSAVALLLVVSDAHRSVWLAAVVSFLIIVVLDYLPISRTRTLVTMGVLFVFVNIVVALVGLDLSSYIESRVQSVYGQQQDLSNAFRLLMWAHYLNVIADHPIMGLGFGGRWDIWLPFFGQVNAAPHNLYIQIAAKLGFVGVGLYLLIPLRAFLRFQKTLKHASSRVTLDTLLIILAQLVLISSHAYYMVYALDPFAWSWIGLGLAVLMYPADNVQDSVKRLKSPSLPSS